MRIGRCLVNAELKAARHAYTIKYHSRWPACNLPEASLNIFIGSVDRRGGTKFDTANRPRFDQVTHDHITGAEKATP